jgi:nucleotide-binding universal stress UspA family protein
MLIPLDGSKAAENVLPYARFLAGKLEIPVELLSVIDIADLAGHVAAEKARYFETILDENVRRGLEYLRGVATTFPSGNVQCGVEKGRPEEVIIEKGEADSALLIAMATHGRSGIDRWLLGSVAEKVLRGSKNALIVIRATKDTETAGELAIKSLVVPLDGSELAERVLPSVAELAKKLHAPVVLFRAYNLPPSLYAGVDGYYVPDLDKLSPELREEAEDYLKKKTTEFKKVGVENVTYEFKEGLSPDQIIRFGRGMPDSLIAMCSHGRSGVKRWALGSVTETVVRHSDDPVLVVRAT